MKTRFPVFATLLTLLGVAILCGLGFWQVERLEWKTEILTKLEAEYAQDPSSLTPADLAQNFDYKRGTLHGTYDYAKEIRLGPRVYDQNPGFHILTPLRLDDGSYILVNRGWVPQDWTDNRTNESGSVTGLLRKPHDRNPFTPPNEPTKDTWYSADAAEIAQAKNLKNIHSYIFYRESADTAYPVAQATKPDIANNHLQYAGFWFTMAGILFVIYILRFLKRA